jgi:DNA-binding CsgD family transcriptional regulator/tetratricopeptide (TPR) repeat protein
LVNTVDQGVALPPDVQNAMPARLVGRTDLLATVESQLAAGGSVVLTGPAGIGKTAVVEALAAAAVNRGERVLRVSGAETERWISYAGLADLLAQVPDKFRAELPRPQKMAVDGVLMRTGSGGTGSRAQLARRLAWYGLLNRCAAGGPVLLVVDDAQWLDGASADVIGYAARRIGGRGVRAVVAERWPDRSPDRSADRVGERRSPRLGVLARGSALVPSPAVELAVPPLAADDLVDLLELYGLPCRAASKLHADSGGNPYLALALGGAFAGRTASTWQPVPLPTRVAALLQDRLDTLPSGVRETLLVAAVATQPTIALLARTGHAEAERHIRLAAAAGLLVLDGSLVRFTPPAVATVLADGATVSRRAEVHQTLSDCVADPVERARHRAMASLDPDAEVARSLVAAAEVARRRGARGFAAELYLLAADRTPPELHSERLEWLVAAAEAAAAASRPELATRAAEAILGADVPPDLRVRARMALIDMSGQALSEMDEALAVALADADGDPVLTASVRLRLAWQAMVDGAPRRAELEADRALALARRVGGTTTEVLALTVLARAARVSGRTDFGPTLERALALPQPPLNGWLHTTPRYLAARFAIFDDRLDEARADLLRMLAVVERGGGEELVEVLRSLSEVSARAGRCREALDFAERAMRVSQDTGLSPGPCWYNAAVAELAGGTIARAAAYADRGVRASEQEHDAIFLSRNLHALGQARLRAGDARGGVEVLRRIRDLEAAQGVGEPSVLRWHSDLAAGLVAVGEFEEAEATVDAVRKVMATRAHSAGVTARVDRAEALLLSERGNPDAAAALLTDAARRFELLGQPIERGHTLLVLGQVERRRRRYAAARTAVGAALDAFTRTAAKPWMEQAVRTLARVDGAPAEPPVREQVTRGGALTASEARIAGMVREGASNREIATRLFLSVKTVEATLTRIYRKLGVRSRTQLSSRLSPG